MYVGVVDLLRNLPLYGGIRLTVNTIFREPARRSYRTIDRLLDLYGGIRLTVNTSLV